jgi:hypothetical protein
LTSKQHESPISQGMPTMVRCSPFFVPVIRYIEIVYIHLPGAPPTLTSQECLPLPPALASERRLPIPPSLARHLSADYRTLGTQCTGYTHGLVANNNPATKLLNFWRNVADESRHLSSAKKDKEPTDNDNIQRKFEVANRQSHSSEARNLQAVSPE